MNSSKGILDKITGASEQIIAENISAAEVRASEIVDIVNNASSDRIKAFEATAKATYDEVIRRRVSVANLDAKKVVMNAKREAMNNLFDKTLNEACEITKARYLKIIEGMITSNAEDGDVVIISEADDKRITKTFVEGIAKTLKKKLTLAKEYGEFKGGIVLSNASCDKNLTFEVELNSIREVSETELASKIFKE